MNGKSVKKWGMHQVHEIMKLNLLANVKKDMNHVLRGTVKTGKTEWTQLISLIMQIALQVLAGQNPDIKKLVLFLQNIWIKYCDISFIPNTIEKEVVGRIAEILIPIIVKAIAKLIDAGVIKRDAIEPADLTWMAPHDMDNIPV